MFTHGVAKFGITKVNALLQHIQNETSDVVEVRERFITGILERDGSKLLTKYALLTLYNAQLCKPCVPQGTSQWKISAFIFSFLCSFQSTLRSSALPCFNKPSGNA